MDRHSNFLWVSLFAIGCGSGGGREGECIAHRTRCGGDDTIEKCINGTWRPWTNCGAEETCALDEGKAICRVEAASQESDDDTDTNTGTDTDTELLSETIFNQEGLLEYRVTIDEGDLKALEAHGDDETYVPASLHIAGGDIDASFDVVGFRHKGAWSLHHCYETGEREYENECAKISYKVKFSEYDKDARFYGYKRVNLHAMSGDGTKLRERLAYDLFNRFGVIAPQTAYATLYINDDFSGLFLQVEQIDGRFTAFHFPDDGDGNLYKEIWPKTGVDDDHYLSALRTNDNPEDHPDVSDMHAFAEAIEASTEETFLEEMAAYVDVDNLLRYLAVDRAIKNWDGIVTFYSPLTPHNFYWYHEALPGGIFHLIPWDMDGTLWPADPYMHPDLFGLASQPVPDWNVLPTSCDGISLWEPDSTTQATPPGCDRLINRLAATRFDRFAALGETLIRDLFNPEVMGKKTAAWSRQIVDIVKADPYVDYNGWQDEVAAFEATFSDLVADFEDHLEEGYIIEIPVEEPDPEVLNAEIPESGIIPDIINNYEFTGGAADTAPVGTSAISHETTTTGVSWNTDAPLSGDADLRLDFTFTREPGAWNEWINLFIETEDGQPVDISAYAELSITLRSDRTRNVRLSFLSEVYEDYGGVWSDFGTDIAVTDTSRIFKLPLLGMTYPDWARDAWETDQGWTVPDEAVLDEILTRFTGVKLSPSPITDGTGEMVDATEPGFLQIDNIYFH